MRVFGRDKSRWAKTFGAARLSLAWSCHDLPISPLCWRLGWAGHRDWCQFMRSRHTLSRAPRSSVFKRKLYCRKVLGNQN